MSSICDPLESFITRGFYGGFPFFSFFFWMVQKLSHVFVGDDEEEEEEEDSP